MHKLMVVCLLGADTFGVNVGAGSRACGMVVNGLVCIYGILVTAVFTTVTL